jgi:phosphopantetheine adenylyltransferase
MLLYGLENSRQSSLSKSLETESRIVKDWPRASGKTMWIASRAYYVASTLYEHVTVIVPDFNSARRMQDYVQVIVDANRHGMVSFTPQDRNKIIDTHAISISSGGIMRFTYTQQWEDAKFLEWMQTKCKHHEILIDGYRSVHDFYECNRSTGEQLINPKYHDLPDRLIALDTSLEDIKRNNPWHCGPR